MLLSETPHMQEGSQVTWLSYLLSYICLCAITCITALEQLLIKIACFTQQFHITYFVYNHALKNKSSKSSIGISVTLKSNQFIPGSKEIWVKFEQHLCSCNTAFTWIAGAVYTVHVNGWTTWKHNAFGPVECWLRAIQTHFLTSFSFLAQGFWAFLKPSSASLVSLNPPIICLW